MSELDENLTEVFSRGSKLACLDTMGEHVPTALNYHDLMQLLTPEEWDRYRVFSSPLGKADSFVFGGISPEGNLNVYGTSAPAIRAMAQRLLAATDNVTPPFFRSTTAGIGLLSALPALQRSRPFLQPIFALRSNVESLPMPTSEYSLRRAEEGDAALVRQWYQAYNSEMGATYRPPAPGTDAIRSLYLLTDKKNRLVGAVAHTIPHRTRFWLGRFFVPKEFRRKGLGRQLLFQLHQVVPPEAREIHLHVNTDNGPAVAFYRSLGFTDVGELFYAKYSR